MLLYEVNGDMLSSKDVFRLYGNGSSSEDEHCDKQPLYTIHPKTTITYLSETDSSSDYSSSSFTSSDSGLNSEHRGNFHQAQGNRNQSAMPLRSAFKKPKISKSINHRKCSLHSTEEINTSLSRSLGPKQLRFCTGHSTTGIAPDISSPLSRYSSISVMSASPPSILQKSLNIQDLISNSHCATETYSKKYRPSTADNQCIINIEEDLDGALQHIKDMFPSPGDSLRAKNKGVLSKEKFVTETHADVADGSEESLSYGYDDREGVAMPCKVSKNSSRILEDSQSSVGAVRHVCDNSRIIRSFRNTYSPRLSLCSVLNHSLNKHQNEVPLSEESDSENDAAKTRIPEL